MKRILVIGSINMDLVLQTDRIPGGGESFLGRSYSWVPGGKGANQGVAAARAGGEVTFLGKLGNDNNGETLRRKLEETGINVSFLLTSGTSLSGMAVIMVEPSGENRIIVYPEANLDLLPADVDKVFGEIGDGGAEKGPRHDSPAFDALLLSFEIPVPVIEHAVTRAKNAGVPVYIDAGPVREVDLATFRGVRLFSPNRTELEALTGMPCADTGSTREAAAALFRAVSPEHLVVKCGEEGALYYNGAEQRHVPAFPVKAVDGTAAGDAFTAGLAVEHLRTGDMAAALRFAAAAGALAAGKLGAQVSLPTRREVEDFLRLKEG